MKKNDCASLPVSIPLALLSHKIIQQIQSRSNSVPDLVTSTMAPPTYSNKGKRLKDAQLLVAFSKEARGQAPLARPTACPEPDEPRCSHNLAMTPEDVPRRPDEPKAAKTFKPPACDNFTQTVNDEYELIDLIKANNITRRQILRLISNTDYNNNPNNELMRAHVIEIDDVPDEAPTNEDLFEVLKPQSDHQKTLIMKNYETVRPGTQNDVYDFINRCLVVKNLETERNIPNAMEYNVPAVASNENDGVQREPISQNEAPVLEIANNLDILPVSPVPLEQPRAEEQPPPPPPEQPAPEQPPAPEQLRAPAQRPAQAETARVAQYQNMMRFFQLFNPAMQQQFAAIMAMRNFPRMPLPGDFLPAPAPAPMPTASSSYVQYHPAASYPQQIQFPGMPTGLSGSTYGQKPSTVVSGSYDFRNGPHIQPSASQGNYCRMPPAGQLHAFNMGSMQINSQNMNRSFTPVSPELFQAPLPAPNRYPWEQQVAVGQQVTETASTARRGRRPKTTSTREASLPVPLNKYKQMMGQQKQIEMERRQQQWQRAQATYPCVAWGRHTN